MTDRIAPVTMHKTQNNAPIKRYLNNNVLANLQQTFSSKGAGANGPSLFGAGFAGSSYHTGATDTK